jgi:hypothetical protein
MWPSIENPHTTTGVSDVGFKLEWSEEGFLKEHIRRNLWAQLTQFIRRLMGVRNKSTGMSVAQDLKTEIADYGNASEGVENVG